MSIDLDAIEARIAAATPGPWEAGITAYGPSVEVDDEQLFIESYGITYPHNPADADLIAHAPIDLSALLAELRATSADLAVAVEVARERGEEVERLRADVFTLRADARMADDISRDRARERAEITRLRAVADAARDLIDCDPDTAQLDYLIELEDAVNAWRAGGGA